MVVVQKPHIKQTCEVNNLRSMIVAVGGLYF